MNGTGLAWARESISDALAALAHAARLPTRPAPRLDASGGIEPAAAALSVEVEPVSAAYSEVEALLRGIGPGLLELPDGSWLVVIGRRRSQIVLLTPDLGRRWLDVSVLKEALTRPLEESVAEEIDRLLLDARIAGRHWPRVKRALLDSRLAARPIGGAWLLRALPGASFGRELVRTRVVGNFALFVLTHLGRLLAALLSWWWIGRAALDGRFESGVLLGWALLLATQVTLGAASDRCRSRAAIDAAALLERRLLAGATELGVDEVRAQGIGRLLGRVLESEAIEALAFGAGLSTLSALIELSLALDVLASGAVGAAHAVSLGAWLLGTLLGARIYHRRRQRWTQARLDLTHDQCERMLGHRTRLAHERVERWHDGEDEMLERYLRDGLAMDVTASVQRVLAPRGWLILGIAVLAPSWALLDGSTEAWAISLGGVLFAFRALRQLTGGLAGLSTAVLASDSILDLFRAAARSDRVCRGGIESGPDPSGATPLLEAQQLTFRHAEHAPPLIEGCNLSISSGDRILLEGRSGSGKSTLGALLAGLRQPHAGLLLSNGLDLATTGHPIWRRRVAAVPQFHENHVLTASFSFNLLMGRSWPPSRADLALAQTLCEELELGPLLERMPSGLGQMLGESGWQLSHGERSRLFLARALLRDPDVLILDESFAALDPVTFAATLGCVMQRARSLLVIAHP